MKNILSILLISLSSIIQAQDTLFLTNSEIIECEVVSTDAKEVEYTPWKKDNPVYSINVTLIDSIYYNSGEPEYFMSKPSKVAATTNTTKVEDADGDYIKGYTDGLNSHVKSVGATSFVGGFCCGVPGIVAPLINISNAEDRIPIEKRVSDKSYDKGYVEGVKKSVRKKAWTNYALGFASAVGVYVAITQVLL